jgi:hypothetical protein
LIKFAKENGCAALEYDKWLEDGQIFHQNWPK